MDNVIPKELFDGKSLLEIIESKNPYCYYAELQNYGGVIKWDRDNCILVTRFNLVREVMSVGGVYTSSHGVLFQADQVADDLALPLFMMSQPDHTKARIIAANAFSKKRNSLFYDMYFQYSNKILIDYKFCHDSLDLVRDYATEVAIRCLLGLIGIDGELRDRIAIHMRVMVDPSSSVQLESYEFKASQVILKETIIDKINKSQETYQDDFISCVINGHNNGEKLSKEEAISLVYLGVFGGFEDIIRLVVSSLEILSNETEIFERLKVSDRMTLNRFVDESIRFGSSTHVMRRTSLVDHYLDGVKINKGDKVVTLIAGANHDPRVFPNPQKFDIDRPNSRSAITFGHGPHVCIGRHIAKEIISAAIQAFVVNVCSFEINQNHGKRHFNNNVCGYIELPAKVVWEPTCIAVRSGAN